MSIRMVTITTFMVISIYERLSGKAARTQTP